MQHIRTDLSAIQALGTAMLLALAPATQAQSAAPKAAPPAVAPSSPTLRSQAATPPPPVSPRTPPRQKTKPLAAKDGAGELDEANRARLQMKMDQKGKTTQTLSNVLKKQSETAAGVVQNQK